jgi:hypothetical protein
LSGNNSWLGSSWQAQALERTEAPDFRGVFIAQAGKAAGKLKQETLMVSTLVSRCDRTALREFPHVQAAIARHPDVDAVMVGQILEHPSAALAVRNRRGADQRHADVGTDADRDHVLGHLPNPSLIKAPILVLFFRRSGEVQCAFVRTISHGHLITL